MPKPSHERKRRQNGNSFPFAAISCPRYNPGSQSKKTRALASGTESVPAAGCHPPIKGCNETNISLLPSRSSGQDNRDPHCLFHKRAMTTKRSGHLIAILALLVPSGAAAQGTPKVEIFGGYCYLG